MAFEGGVQQAADETLLLRRFGTHRDSALTLHPGNHFGLGCGFHHAVLKVTAWTDRRVAKLRHLSLRPNATHHFFDRRLARNRCGKSRIEHGDHSARDRFTFDAGTLGTREHEPLYLRIQFEEFGDSRTPAIPGLPALRATHRMEQRHWPVIAEAC